ncbi:PQQ-dependent sugar dehydrogenase [Catellatospora sp. KI3]|uniref:PQQ-dependent sugar dehydrogenase n=1 Tax=Catellatospora sp. KI3 TaxID=3041620 RepID=UPI0024826729|nr:PQQ-dependent sugar dehydrogenase [Catellatospora sp. KI3]MDI1465941.1 PQQ-dependent sugar dehydrogenase [Catellatospora sp. KI3]
MNARKIALAGEGVLLTLVMAAAGVVALVRPAAPAGPVDASPLAPTISEPSTDGQLVSGADLHMEAQPFADPDVRDEHRCTDWEVWTVAPAQVERVWAAECITGAQRLHAHLGDGLFQGALAGAAELPPETSFEVRSRHRDSSGDATAEWGPWSVRTFRTDAQLKPLPGAPIWRTFQDGYVVEEVASGFSLPVNIAMVPAHASAPSKPMFYVTELYGQIKVVRGDFTVGTYAKDLLNFDPRGRKVPGDGEIGLTGIVVEPASGDVFASMLYRSNSGSHFYPKVVRFHSEDGGFTAAEATTVLDMKDEAQEASHQVSNLTIGPDGKLYVHMADGFEPKTARKLDSFRGKVLRVNLDGSAPEDNPFYDAKDGIKAKDYVFASGFRNPFGGAWRAEDGQHYSVENGPSVDRFARVTRGADYGWYAGDSAMRKKALYNWGVAHGPVNIAFVQRDGNQSAGFPQDKFGHAFVSESGPTYATGPQVRGKRIVEFTFDGDGKVGEPTTLVEYNGNGKSSVAGLAAGADGLYFTALYPDDAAAGPYAAKAKIYRVRYASEAGAAPRPVKLDPKLCTDDELSVTVVPAWTRLDAGAPLSVTLKVKNSSKRSCSRDIGADLQEVRLQRGAVKIWSSDDCGPAHGTLPARFAPGYERVFQVAWNGESSSKCTKRGHQRVPDGGSPDEGDYQLVGRIGSDRSKPVTITLK